MKKNWKVYEYSRCSTCRNALQYLEKKGIPFEAIPIVEKPPSLAELKTMLGYLGSIKKLFNTSGEVYRDMKLSEKLPSMSEAQALQLLSKNGKLIKRPFVLGPGRGLVGFKEPEWRDVFA